jgi:hypothetical protein
MVARHPTLPASRCVPHAPNSYRLENSVSARGTVRGMKET